MKSEIKAALTAGLLTFVFVLPLNLTLTEIREIKEAERTIKPPPIEAPATTAREKIVAGVCTFGDCPVLRPTEVSVTNSTAVVKFPLTTVEKTSAVNEEITATVAKMETVDEVVVAENATTEPVTERHNDGYIGTFYITGYTAEEGFPAGRATASGYGVRPGYCAMNDSQRRSLGIRYGDQIYVDGLGTYTVMDSGCGWGVVDIWVQTNAEAYRITGYREVYFG